LHFPKQLVPNIIITLTGQLKCKFPTEQDLAKKGEEVGGLAGFQIINCTAISK
jgi:hypothetical protein